MLAATPAGAHVGGTVNHLWDHLKPKADARYLQNTKTFVVSGTVNNGSFDTAIANCPVGWQAVGGGVDPNNVLTMDVTSSNPVIQGTRTLLTPNGENGRATGWLGAVTNNSGSAATFKVAVICSR